MHTLTFVGGRAWVAGDVLVIGGVTIGDVLWPTPGRILTEAGSMRFSSYAYEGEVLTPIAVEVPASARPGVDLPISVEATFSVCSDTLCIPEPARLTLSLPGAYETAGAVMSTIASNVLYDRADDYVFARTAAIETITPAQVDVAAQTLAGAHGLAHQRQAGIAERRFLAPVQQPPVQQHQQGHDQQQPEQGGPEKNHGGVSSWCVGGVVGGRGLAKAGFRRPPARTPMAAKESVGGAPGAGACP